MGLFVWRLVTTIGYRITRFTWLRFVARLGDDTWLGVGEFPFPTTPSNNPQRAVRSSPTRKRITMVGTAAVGLTAPAVRPVARATQGASARAARSVRVGAVVPGVSSRRAPGRRAGLGGAVASGAGLRGAGRGCVTAPCAAAVSSLASARATPRGRSTPWNSRNAFRCVSRRRTREAPAVFYLRRRAPPSDGAGDETSNDRPLGWCGSAEKDGRTSEPRASWFIACVRDSATALPRHVTLSCPRVPARVSRCSAISR